MDLIFIRHGQPAWSVDGYSQPDPALTELGHRQAELTAKRLSAELDEVAEILVSPALRSQQTAVPIVEAMGVAPQTIDDLVEIQLPNWEGKLEQQVQKIFLDARHRPPEEWWEGLEGGESFRDFHERIVGAMSRILSDRSVRPHDEGIPHLWHVETDPKRIVIVAHGGTNAVALGWLLGLDPTPWEWERFVLGHTSMARVQATPLAGEHVFSLRTFNDVEHLSASERTR
ncbi:MAG: histidine phosphatase family protein [Acidimicrobiia bacterium]|nr:histidine phosphatase family protein [Acidimicrobiia bacterium]NNK91975.1 histidine phosphatase family protein [Acidimicrobiia bacterium]